MDNFNFNFLKYFYYVVYYNGFTNASKNLNIAQSALSYNVKSLENILEKKLIIRDNKKFELTEDGNNLYETLKDVFGMLERNIDHFHTNEIVYEEISIGIRHYLSDFILKNSLTKFTCLCPNVHINLYLYSKLDIDEFNEKYDILIDYTDYTNMIQNVNKTKLVDLENVFIVGSTLYENYREVESIKELSNNKFISLCPSRKNGRLQEFCFKNDLVMNNIISVNDSKISKELVINNMGIAFANKKYFADEITNDKVKIINVNEEIFSDEVTIAYKVTKNDYVKKFVDILMMENGSDN